MRVLFARVGYMKFYQGPQPGDEKQIGGGEHNRDAVGHEVYNFLDVDGRVYGYFQPHMKEPYEINLGRVEKGWGKPSIDKVLVIWFASDPIGRGQVVIGWYRNAVVHQGIAPKGQRARNNFAYNVEAKAQDAVLLPLKKRTFEMGHDIEGEKAGNPGQANCFYALDARGDPKDLRDPHTAWIKGVIDYVQGYKGSNLLSPLERAVENSETAEYAASQQGLLTDVEIRLLIEKHAMDRCEQYFKRKGYVVKDQSKSESFDFLVSKAAEEFRVEVKGTQTLGRSIILTKNEVELSRTGGNRMILFLVHSIALHRKSVKADSGETVVVRPWKLDASLLTPISYMYDLAEHRQDG